MKTYFIPNAILLFIFLVSCSSDIRTEKIDQKFLENISPGSAIAKFKVENFVINKTEAKINVELVEVLGYGSSTKPLNSGSKFSFNLSSEDIDKTILKLNSILILEIAQQEEQMIETEDQTKSNSWHVVRIFNKMEN